MSTTLREVLARRADDVGPAELNVDELIALGEHRLHRRRIGAIAGSAAALVLAIAIALGGTALNRSADPGPTNHPTNTDHSTGDKDDKADDQAGPIEPQTRPLIYTDDVT